jgi:hypothetical protein
MTKEMLHRKTNRYLVNASQPAETRQIQNWLSCIEPSDIPQESREQIEQKILDEIKAYTAYPLFYPKPAPWWRKFTAFF